MVPLLQGCNTPKRVPWGVEKSCVFDGLKGPGIDLFDKESVNRYSLGYSACPLLDFHHFLKNKLKFINST